jgi:hypothetical protein
MTVKRRRIEFDARRSRRDFAPGTRLIKNKCVIRLVLA